MESQILYSFFFSLWFFAREEIFCEKWKLSSDATSNEYFKTFKYSSLGLALQLTVKWTTNLIRFAFAIEAMSTDTIQILECVQCDAYCICNETDTTGMCHKIKFDVNEMKIGKKRC